MKCLCFCYLGLELALTRGPVAVIGELTTEMLALIRAGAHVLTWATAAFCFLRGLPVFFKGWHYLDGNLSQPATVRTAGAKSTAPEAA